MRSFRILGDVSRAPAAKLLAPTHSNLAALSQARIRQLMLRAAAGIVGAGFGQHLLAANPVPTSHKVIGWLVIALATVQITAFLLRPSEVCPSAGHWMMRRSELVRVWISPLVFALAELMFDKMAAHSEHSSARHGGSMHGSQTFMHGPWRYRSSCRREEVSRVGCLRINAMQDRSIIRAFWPTTGVRTAQQSRLRPLFNVYHRWTAAAPRVSPSPTCSSGCTWPERR